MANEIVVNDLWCHVNCVSRKTASPETARFVLPGSARCEFLGLQYIALDQLTDSSATAKDNHRFNFRDILPAVWGIFFPDHGREIYRRLEGEDRPPIVVYKVGARYFAADEQDLAAARYLGQVFVLAEVWELSLR